MPTSGPPPVPPLFKLSQAVFRGGIDVLMGVFDDGIDCIVETAKAIPNIVLMTDILLRYFTSITGRILAIPFRGYGVLYQEAILAYYGSRLMRADEAMKLFWRIPEEMVQAVTATDETGLIEYALQALSLWLWRKFKLVRSLMKLMRVTTPEQFVEWIWAKWKGRARLIFYILLFVLIMLCWVAAFSAVLPWGLSLVIWKGDFEDYLLPQDSKRVWKKKGHQARENARRGPDQ